MPNFKKSDGFTLGGSPFTMKKGSKELDTEGSFREEAKNKMGSYGSPLFAIQSDGINAGLDAMTQSKQDGDAAKRAGMESMGKGVEDVGSEIMSAKTEEEESSIDKTNT
tara:strand:+ start:872 stop:1198 length:327 start_codon:yes stop_codon:yes gene_type:complete